MLKLIKFLKPYRLIICAIVLLVFIQSLSQLFLPGLMADIVDNGIVSGDINYIFNVGLVMILVTLGGTICAIGASFLASKTAIGFGKQVRSSLFTHIQSFSLNEYDKFGAASLITRTTNDIVQVQMVVLMMLRMMFTAPLMMIGGIIMAVSRDPQLSMVVFIVMPLLVLTITVIAKKGLPLFKAVQTKLDKLNRVMRENLTGIRVIRAFNRIDHEQNRFDVANKDLTNTAIKVNKLMAVAMPLMTLLLNLTAVATIWYGSFRVDAGSMQVGDLMAFLQYIMFIMFSLMMVSMMFVMIPRAMVSADRVSKVLEVEPKIKDPETKNNPKKKKGHIEFKNVSFYYPGAEKPALSNISFSAKPGEVTAIIGSTGSGKSTLVNLMPRFYDVTCGDILINDVSIKDFSQKHLREKIGYVPQKALLFSGTISDNIRYGKDNASDEEVRHAAETAQALEFISDMKDGFESEINQGGVNLSGGQKQRLSIARALIRKPEIYIFDDSFSALDFKTDAQLRKALKSETKDSTLLIVGQRVSSIMDADRIIVLDQGKIAGMGTHKELMESSEVYQQIVFSQLSKEEIA
ncbi:ABC transporter ATP-binding protein [Proteinivorax hydrogeniformans]|uniref:ABC transporter ATP-binding protein n=1 Tax=Proteinivorax hydrogeniformans TaxID=1826727 RepID=A0AAU8HUU0_9FIRM